MSRTFARRATALALAGGLVTPLVAVDAHAEPTRAPRLPATPLTAPLAADGSISYWDGQGTAFIAGSDGSNPRVLATNASSAPAWAPDGSRFVYLNNGFLKTRRASGTDPVTITDSGLNPAWSNGGAFVFFDRNGRIQFANSDGTFVSDALFDPGANCSDSAPTLAPGTILIFERTCDGAAKELFTASPDGGDPTPLGLTGHSAAFSPDGSMVSYLVDAAGNETQLWTANSNGSNPTLLTGQVAPSSTGGRTAAWSPDGQHVVYPDASNHLQRINVASKQVTALNQNGSAVTQQPILRNAVDRVWGQDHVDTAIATSQFNYANAGTDPDHQAKAVVLSRDDTFLDALVGSAFAADSQAPLLITRRTDLDSRVEAEIKRVLGPTGTVFLLGGPIALNQPVEDRLHTLGYATERIFGQTHFDTAIAIDQKIAGGRTPQTAIVATGVNFFDALAAGAAAGAQPGTVIVLTNGDQLPAQSAAYLNSLNPDVTLVVSAGGPGDRALINSYQDGQMPNWPSTLNYAKLVGNNEKDTALLIAQGFFGAPGLTAIATNRTWMDALTGGAMVGFNGGPLLITDPTSLYPGVQQYLNNESGSLFEAAMLGGPFALADSLKAPIGDAISVPGQWDFFDLNPNQVAIAADQTGQHQASVRGGHVAPDANAKVTR